MTEARERQRRAWSTDADIAAYERGRPGYPDDAVDWLVGDARRVLELGAGTGKLTRSLVARGLSVVAVEPLDTMRAHLARAVPGAEVLAGTAEDVPAGDGEFDLVLAAQCWHWFDASAAALEAARVLRPGGRLGLVWNEKDDDLAPWVAELSRLMHGGYADAAARVRAEAAADSIRLPAHFGPVEAAEYYFGHELDRAGLVDMVTSRSYVIVLPEGDRARLLDRVLALADAEMGRTGRETLSLPYLTECYRATPR